MTYDELKKAYEAASEKCAFLEQELENKNQELENKNQELENKNQELENKNRELEDKNIEIENLTEQILKRNQMLFGRKSEKSKYIDIDGQMIIKPDGTFVVNEAEEQADETPDEQGEEMPDIEKSEKKKHPHRGCVKLREDLPTKEVEFELPEEERKCSVCGDELVPFSRKFMGTRVCIIPAKVIRVNYYSKVYKCKNCDKNGIKANIVTAPDGKPAAVVPKGIADASLIADIMQRKYQLGMPLYRQEKYWEAQGIYLNRTPMANWVIAGGKWFGPLVEMLWKYAYAEPVLNVDETSLKVLNINGKPNGKKCTMWICATGAKTSKRIAVYAFRTDKKKDTADEMLAAYSGIVQTDGYAAYGDGNYINAGCWAHCRRKFFDSIPKGNKKCKAAHAVMLIDKMMELERKAREKNYDDGKLLKMRSEKIKPLIDEFYSFLETLNPGSGSHLCTAVNYAQNQKKELLVFLDYPKVEMTNNLAERTVKPFVIDRKNFLFSDTDKGADASAAVMTVIETAKRNNLDVYGYLYFLLTRLPAIEKNPSEEALIPLMPWSDSLPDYCKAQFDEIIG